MKRNLLRDLERVLAPLQGCELGESLLHAAHRAAILQVCRVGLPPVQLGIYGIWQLTNDDLSLCAYIGGKNRDGILLKHLRRVEGQRIVSLRFLAEKRHLFLHFENDVHLRVFASPLRNESYRLIVPTPQSVLGEGRSGCRMTGYGVHQGGIVRATWVE